MIISPSPRTDEEGEAEIQEPKKPVEPKKAAGNIVSRSLNDWLCALNGPDPAVFYKDAQFGEAQFGYFSRILTPALALVAAEFGVSKLSSHIGAGLPDQQLYLKFVAIFIYISLVYRFYAKLFRIDITLSQAFFCFALVAVPWIPVLGALRLVTPIGAVVFELSFWGIMAYIPWLIADGVARVTGRKQLYVFVSIMFGIVLIALLSLWPDMVDAYHKLQEQLKTPMTQSQSVPQTTPQRPNK